MKKQLSPTIHKFYAEFFHSGLGAEGENLNCRIEALSFNRKGFES